MTSLARRVAGFIAGQRLIEPGRRVLVGLSGGADSVALLSLLREAGHECVAVHCHFGLRGAEADRDLRHSREIAGKLGAEFVGRHFDARSEMARRGISAEMACRDLRYELFERMRESRGCDVIAVGHHREDNVETLFLNLLRGCGIHGVRAMEPRRGNVVRPLLEVSKAELLDYLAERGLTYVTDSTNLVADVARNRLRLEVLPALRRAFPDADRMISRSLSNLRGCERLYNSLLPERSASLKGVTPTLLHEWLAPYGFNATQCADILRSSAGAEFTTASHRLAVCRDATYELVELVDAGARRPRLQGRICPREANFAPRHGVLYMDARAACDATWQLRLWQPGDRIRPFGMRGSRLVADVLADAGVSAPARRQCWLLLRNGEVVWIVGVRASALFPVTETTTQIIEIISHENI